MGSVKAWRRYTRRRGLPFNGDENLLVDYSRISGDGVVFRGIKES